MEAGKSSRGDPCTNVNEPSNSICAGTRRGSGLQRTPDALLHGGGARQLGGGGGGGVGGVGGVDGVVGPDAGGVAPLERGGPARL